MNPEVAISLKYVILQSSALMSIVAAMYMDKSHAKRSVTFIAGLLILGLSASAALALGDVTVIKEISSGANVKELAISHKLIFWIVPILTSGLGMALVCHSILGGINYDNDEDSLLLALVCDVSYVIKVALLTLFMVVLSSFRYLKVSLILVRKGFNKAVNFGRKFRGLRRF